MKRGTQPLDIWKTRYETPTLDALLSGVPAGPRAEIDAFRAKIGRASVRWKGVPWRWSVIVTHDGREIVIVPDPEAPRLAVRLEAGFFDDRPVEKMPKPARDMLQAAVRVGEVVWTEWSLASAGSAAAALELLGIE